MSNKLSFVKVVSRIALCAAIAVSLGFSSVSAVAANGSGAEQTAPSKAVELKPQTTCPVMGNEINKSLFVDYGGKRIYVCCPACIDPVKKNPELYIKKLEKMGQNVETIAVDKPGTAAGSAKLSSASKDTSVASKKCPMMSDSSMKKCAMAGDTSHKKCPMMNDMCKNKGCYTCPMHPDVMKKEAGKCPQCGMDLVFRKCPMDSAHAKGGCCKMKK